MFIFNAYTGMVMRLIHRLKCSLLYLIMATYPMEFWYFCQHTKYYYIIIYFDSTFSVVLQDITAHE